MIYIKNCLEQIWNSRYLSAHPLKPFPGVHTRFQDFPSNLMYLIILQNHSGSEKEGAFSRAAECCPDVQICHHLAVPMWAQP